jgi:hypothetical protein
VQLQVYFGPNSEDFVGIINTTDDSWSVVSTNVGPHPLKEAKKFFGIAATVGSMIYFGPYDADCVGRIDATDDTWACFPTNNATGGSKYMGGVLSASN